LIVSRVGAEIKAGPGDGVLANDNTSHEVILNILLTQQAIVSLDDKARLVVPSVSRLDLQFSGQAMPKIDQQRLRQDLGLGGKLSERSRARLLNHDGTFNVRRNDFNRFHPYNAYHTLLSLPIPRLLGLMALGYLLTNMIFATLYWLCGAGALAGAAKSSVARFEDCLFFSVQTLATIGYGRLVPETRVANMIVAVEALVGLLGFAILSGLLFARFTRPTAKVAFSANALIAPYEGGWALMFRLVNLRNHNLTDVHAVVSFARWVTGGGIRSREFDALTLERDSIIFMPLHWVIVHPITDASPLRGLTAAALAEMEPEFVCLISADDETFAQTVHAKTSYNKTDIVWGAKFSDMYIADVDHVAIDMGRLSDFQRIEPPAWV
jgi:inward rectifier potassium channel